MTRVNVDLPDLEEECWCCRGKGHRYEKHPCGCCEYEDEDDTCKRCRGLGTVPTGYGRELLGFIEKHFDIERLED